MRHRQALFCLLNSSCFCRYGFPRNKTKCARVIEFRCVCSCCKYVEYKCSVREIVRHFVEAVQWTHVLKKCLLFDLYRLQSGYVLCWVNPIIFVFD